METPIDSILFQTPAQIVGYKTKVDRSTRITVDTSKELSPPEAAALHMMLMHNGTLGFVSKENPTDELDALDLPEEILEVGQKSFAERARAVAFLRWKNKGEPETFDIYWMRLKEQILDSLKKGLPPKD